MVFARRVAMPVLAVTMVLAVGSCAAIGVSAPPATSAVLDLPSRLGLSPLAAPAGPLVAVTDDRAGQLLTPAGAWWTEGTVSGVHAGSATGPVVAVVQAARWRSDLPVGRRPMELLAQLRQDAVRTEPDAVTSRDVLDDGRRVLIVTRLASVPLQEVLSAVADVGIR